MKQIEGYPEAGLIQEELCRVIASADRFFTCVEAWRALQTVRRMNECCIKENRLIHSDQPVSSVPDGKSGGESDG